MTDESTGDADGDGSGIPSRSRRRLLRLSGVAAAGLAGCSSDPAPTGASGSPAATESPDSSPAGADSPRDPASLLAAGGVVAYLRPPGPLTTHAESGLVETDACVGDAVLSGEARARARAIGDAFAAVGADVRAAVTSRRCPARDTARLAFGGGTPGDALDGETEASSDGGGEDGAGEDGASEDGDPNTPTADPDTLADLLGSAPASGVRAVVGSGASLAAVADAAVAPGGCAVVDPAGDGFEVVAVGDPTAWAAGASKESLQRGRYALREGTAQETDVVRLRAATEGPTVVAVGGLHGDEVAGYRAASAVTDWSPTAGTVVVVPRANVPAIERGRRTAADGVDLNRQFPLDEPPATPLARELSNVVARHDPDVLVDLHSSAGFWGEGKFGQAVFHSGDDPLASRVDRVVASVNEAVVPPERRPRYDYESVESDGDPPGMFAAKVAADLGVPACVHEVTESGLPVETQVAWSRAVAARLLAAYGVRPLRE